MGRVWIFSGTTQCMISFETQMLDMHVHVHLLIGTENTHFMNFLLQKFIKIKTDP